MSAEKRQREFNELVDAAQRYLTRPSIIPGTPSLSGWYQKIRFWHFPSFDISRTWAIFQRSRPSDRGAIHSLLRQVTWDRPADCKRLLDPLQGLAHGFHASPAIDVRDRTIDTSGFESRMAALRGISFPAFTASPIGLDGESFGIELEHRNIRIEWWCEGPESWRSLTGWADEMRQWLASIASAENAPAILS